MDLEMFDVGDWTGFKSLCKDVGGDEGEGVTACDEDIAGRLYWGEVDCEGD